MGGQRVMRVTVRGRFSELAETAREYLGSNHDEHDVSRAEYTADGTLTYDALTDFFSMHYEIRLDEGDPDELAATRALARPSCSSRRWASATGT